jgi:DNA topoisomerase-2
MTAEQMAEAEAAGLEKRFKLTDTLSSTNMTMFDSAGRIRKFESPLDVLRDFHPLRLEYYHRRKANLVERLSADLRKLENRARFIQAVVDGKLVLAKRSRAELIAQLAADKYWREGDNALPEADAEAEGEAEAAEGAKTGYEYLLGMPLWSLTRERIAALLAEKATKEAELQTLLETTPETMWDRDLVRVLAALDAHEHDLAAAAASGPKGKKAAAGGKRAAVRKRADDDSDVEQSDGGGSDDDFGAAPAPKARAVAKPKPKAAVLVPVVPAPAPLAAAAAAAPAAEKPKAAPKPRAKKADSGAWLSLSLSLCCVSDV